MNMSVYKAALFWTLFLLVFLAAAAWNGCTGSAGGEKGPLTVASKIDTEGSLLGQMIILVLNEHNFKTIDKTQFGTTDVIRKAIMSGEIDIYPEYTGNGGFFYPDTDSTIWKNAEQGYLKVKELDKKQHNLIWLKPAAANNTWAIAVRGDLGRESGLSTLEDFAVYINGGGKVKLACSEEFVSRPDSLPAFEKAYGFHLDKAQLVILSGGNTAQTEKAAAEGTDGVNFAMAYGTDGALAVLGLHVLADTLGVQPVYEPAPIVRGEAFDKYPELAALLDPVFTSLNLETLQKLNGEIVAQGRLARDVAGEYLKSKGFIK
jgi:osmoprotectant transport system substrate-binding protein